MSNLTARIRVILTAAVTWLTVAAGVLTVVAADLTTHFGDSAAPAATWILRAVTWLTFAVLIVRRVTPVLDSARGILPPADARPTTPGEAFLQRELEHQRSLTP